MAGRGHDPSGTGVKFKNTFRIKCKSDTSRLEIIKELKSLENFDIKHIKMIAKLKSNKKWHIEMTSDSIFKQFLGQKLTLDNAQIDLEDANVKPQTTSLFKIMWLPRYITHDKIKEFICTKINPELIKKIENEKMRDQGCDHIDTGLVKFFIIDSVENKSTYENLCGKQSIFGEEVFIIKVGEGKRCIYCSKLNHIKKDCPTLASDQNKHCSKCQNKGHTSKECSISKVISGQKVAETMLNTEDDSLFAENPPITYNNNNNNKDNNIISNNNNDNKDNITITSNNNNNNTITTSTTVPTTKIQFKVNQTSTPHTKRNNPCSNTSNEEQENKKLKDDLDEESLESAYNDITNMRNEEPKATTQKKQ